MAARLSTQAAGRVEPFFFADQERGLHRRRSGADSLAGVGAALEPAGARGAPAWAALGLRWELGAEGVSPRGGEAQELCHPLRQHVAAALQQPALQQLSGHRERGP